MKHSVVLTVVGLGLSALVVGCAPNAGQTGATGQSSVAPIRSHGTTAPTIGSGTPTPAVMSNPQQATGEVVARANGRVVTRDQLTKPLTDAYGLNVLLNLMQLQLAEQEADRAGARVGDDDVKIEFEHFMAQTFKSADKADYPGLLDQVLTQQRLSRAELDIVMRTNANLRKVAEPLVREKVTEDNLRDLFNAQYGEKVRIRHIQCSNLQEWQEARRRIDNGEAFADVARALSRNARTGSLGGELPPFSRQATDLPEVFKSAAFNLKPGELSEAVQSGEAFHLLKLEERITPKAVKFEDMRDVLRDQLDEQFVQATVTELRRQVGALVLRTMTIEDPVLRRQFEDRLKKQEATVTDKNTIRKQMEQVRKEREGAATPTTAPADPVDVTPPGAVSPERPPATMPAP